MDDPNPNFIVLDFFEGLLHSFYRTLYVSLDDDGEFLHFTLCNLAEEVVKCYLLIFAELCLLCFMLPLFYEGLCQTFIFYNVKDIASSRNFCQTGDFNRNRRASFVNNCTLVVGHDTNLSDTRSGKNNIAGVQCPVLNQQGCNWTSALIQPSFDDSTLCTAVRVCLEFLHFCNQQHVFEQFVNAFASLCRNRNAHNIAAPVFTNQIIFGEFFLNTVWICSFFIHLVDGNNQGNASSLCMVDGFYSLRHDTVIRSDNQNGNICDICPSCTHCGERFVSRCIEEGNFLAVASDLICTDVLGDTAGFACGDVGVTDVVQNGSFPVVNVTHNNDNRRAFFGVIGFVLFFNQTFFDGNDDFLFYLCTQFFCNQTSGVEVDFLINGCHNTQAHQLFDDFRCSHFQAACEFADHDGFRNPNLELLFSCLFEFQTAKTVLFGFPLIGIFLLVPLSRLLVDFLLFGGIIILAVLASRSNLLIPLVVLIQIHIRATGINGTPLFCCSSGIGRQFHFHMQPFAPFLCLRLLFLLFLVVFRMVVIVVVIRLAGWLGSSWLLFRLSGSLWLILLIGCSLLWLLCSGVAVIGIAITITIVIVGMVISSGILLLWSSPILRLFFSLILLLVSSFLFVPFFHRLLCHLFPRTVFRCEIGCKAVCHLLMLGDIFQN